MNGLFPWINGQGKTYTSGSATECQYTIDVMNLINHPNIRNIYGLIEFGHQAFNLICRFASNNNSINLRRSFVKVHAPYNMIKNGINSSNRLYYLYPYYSNFYSSRMYVNLYEKTNDGEMIQRDYMSLFTNSITNTFSICNANSAVINLYNSISVIPNNIVISNISDLKICTDILRYNREPNRNIHSLSIYNCNISSTLSIGDEITFANLYNIRSSGALYIKSNLYNWQGPNVHIGDCSFSYVNICISNIQNVTVTNLTSWCSIDTISYCSRNNINRPPLNLYLNNINGVTFYTSNNWYNTDMRNTFTGRRSIDIYISSTTPMTVCEIPYSAIYTDNKNVPVNLSYDFIIDESSNIQLPIPIKYCNIRSISSNVILSGNNLYHHNHIINASNVYDSNMWKSIYSTNWYLPYFNGGICMTILTNITRCTYQYGECIVNIVMNNASSILRDTNSNANDSYGFFSNIYAPNCSYVGDYALSGRNWAYDDYLTAPKIQLGDNVVIGNYAFDNRTICTIMANSIETIMPFAFHNVTYYRYFTIAAPINTICDNAFSGMRCWMYTGGGSNPYVAPFSELGLDAKYIGANILSAGVFGANNSKLSNRTLKLINTIRLNDYALYGANYYNLSLPNTLQYANMPCFNSSINNISVEPDFNCNLNMSGANCNDNVIYNIFTNLVTLPSITKTFTLGSTQLSRCNASTKAIATQKNWTLA